MQRLVVILLVVNILLTGFVAAKMGRRIQLQLDLPGCLEVTPDRNTQLIQKPVETHRQQINDRT